MSGRGEWERVNKRRPCPICEKPDWCLYIGPADGPTAAICARTESDKRCGEAGWLHKLRNDDWHLARRRTVLPARPTERPTIDLAAFARQCHLGVAPDALRRFAESLGLTTESLRRLLVGWSAQHRAWAFPMSDASGQVIGVRLRLPNGRKLAVRGGREGLFLPAGLVSGARLLLAEGPTDTAALLDLGFAAVGRPSCNGGTRHLIELLKRLRPTELVIVADRDEPGRLGAERLAAHLAAYVSVLRVIRPPDGAKDARGWKRSGATHGDVAAVINAAPVRRIGVRVRCKGTRNEYQRRAGA